MPVVVLASAPVLFWMVPPEPALPLPVTCRPPLAPVVSKMTPVALLFDALPDEMLWKVMWLAPMLVLTMLRPVPEVLLIVFGLAPVVTLTVPPPVALKPVPAPVSMSRPPPLKVIVVPALLPLIVTAVLAPVFSVLVVPLRVTAPLPVLFATRTPLPPLEIVPG